jgi:hypothetical protein
MQYATYVHALSLILAQMVVPPYSRPWKHPEDLPSSRPCLGDVPRSLTPVGSPESWPTGLR